MEGRDADVEGEAGDAYTGSHRAESDAVDGEQGTEHGEQVTEQVTERQSWQERARDRADDALGRRDTDGDGRRG